MGSESIQPLSSLGPADPKKAREEAIKNDPAKRDYVEGRELLKQRQYSEAGMAFHNALKGFEEQGDEAGIANACDRLGDVCFAREDYENALAHYQRAYELCDKEQDSFSTLALNKKLAEVYKGLGELNKSLEVYFDMIEYYQITKNPKGTVDTLLLVANVYLIQGERERAADAYRTISSIHKNFKHSRKAAYYAAEADKLS
jgi:tetratricopeptide (TPR) repeat protein